MAYSTTATDLTADLQQFLEDDDTEFQGSIPDIINLGELRVIRDLKLSIFYGTATTPTVQGDENLVKPAGYLSNDLGVDQLYYESGASNARTFLELRSVDFVNDYLTSAEGPPRYYAEPDETNWIVAPRPDAVYTVTARYLDRPPSLVVTTQENNWLSDNVGDLLLKASLVESEEFLKSDDRIGVWKTDYQELLAETKDELYPLMRTGYNDLRAFPLGA